jgi:malonyl-CoA O-methyltransferase
MTSDDVAAAYDQWAEHYDTDPNKTRELAAFVLRQQNLQLNGRKIIEIGCGTGGNTKWLFAQDAEVVALDFSAGMLSVARTRVRSPKVRFLHHDIKDTWPISDLTADLIIAMLVLEHIEDLQPIFTEAARCLRPRGELYICELHPFRQLSGRQAEFIDQETGELERVAAHLHDVSDYVNTALSCDFELLHLGEWRDVDARPSDLPRLLSIHLRSGRG